MLEHQFLLQDRLKLANTTHNWFYVDDLKRHNEAKRKDNPVYGPGDVVYKFNNRGFRCDDFDSWENHPYRILFAGCSMTEGVGAPLEVTWAKLFHNKICEKLNTKIPFWNIAHGAASTDHLVKHLYLEGETLKPQVVISHLPFLERRERWSGDHWGPWDLTTKENQQIAGVFLKENYIRYQTEKNLVFVNLLMNKWNSNFLYSVSNPEYDFSSIKLPRLKKVDHSFDITDRSRDGYHPGPESHRIFAEKMFETLWPTISEKLHESK